MNSTIDKIERIEILFYEGEKLSLPVSRLSLDTKTSICEEISRFRSHIFEDAIPIPETDDTTQLRIPSVRTHCALMKVDVADHSIILKNNKARTVDRLLNDFRSFVEKAMQTRHGEIWSWEGDGGICFFINDECEERATLCAMDILTGMRVFNLEQNLHTETLDIKSLDIRMAVHAGSLAIPHYKGDVHSEVINFVCHLESKGTGKNSISISHAVYRELSASIKRCFALKGQFEDIDIYVSLGVLGK